MKAQFYNKLILWTIIVLSIGWIVYAACDLFGPTFEIFSFVLIIPALPCVLMPTAALLRMSKQDWTSLVVVCDVLSLSCIVGEIWIVMLPFI